jgi:hypothetical protein
MPTKEKGKEEIHAAPPETDATARSVRAIQEAKVRAQPWQKFVCLIHRLTRRAATSPARAKKGEPLWQSIVDTIDITIAAVGIRSGSTAE